MDTSTAPTLETLLTRIDALEARVAQLEAGGGASGSRRAARAGGAGGGDAALVGVDATAWTTTYAPVTLEAAESWIELHEPSARPQLQRMIREVVDGEGPVTDRLALDRVRRAWGLKRAGGRVQEAFDQALRQLLARGLVERHHDGLRTPGSELTSVRVPGADEATRRGAEDVPLEELALGIARVTRSAGGRSVAEDDVTMQVAKLLGWTRRGGAIQERLDAALELAETNGSVARSGGQLSVRAAG